MNRVFQVWHDYRLVGHVTLPPGLTLSRQIVLHNIDDPGAGGIKLTAIKRHAAASGYELATKPELVADAFRRLNVPADAVLDKDFATDQTIYRWTVFEVDLDTYEELFDHPAFEAC